MLLSIAAHLEDTKVVAKMKFWKLLWKSKEREKLAQAYENCETQNGWMFYTKPFCDTQ